MTKVVADFTKRAVKVIGVVLALCVLVYAAYVILDQEDTVVEYVAPVVEEKPDLVQVKADELFESDKFQAEMRALAKARAMFELSNEKQREAVELGKNAMDLFMETKQQSLEWYDEMMYVSTTTLTAI